MVSPPSIPTRQPIPLWSHSCSGRTIPTEADSHSGINTQSQPARFLWIHLSTPLLYFPLSLSTSDLFNWKNIPTYQDDSFRIDNLFSIFATHCSGWARVQSVLTTLTEEGSRMVPAKAGEDASRPPAAAPAVLPTANAIPIPTTDPGWVGMTWKINLKLSWTESASWWGSERECKTEAFMTCKVCTFGHQKIPQI